MVPDQATAQQKLVVLAGEVRKAVAVFNRLDLPRQVDRLDAGDELASRDRRGKRAPWGQRCGSSA
jgi:hypothetical protein